MSKRPLISSTILFVCGVILCAYEISFALASIFCLTVCLFTYSKTKKPFISLFAVFLILSGVLRMNLAQNSQSRIISEYSGLKTTMTLTVSDFSVENKTAAYFKDGNKKHKVYLITKENAMLSPGDIIEGEITLYTPLKSETGLQGAREFYAGKNIFLTASAEKITPTKEKESGFMGKIYSLRCYMDTLGKKAFSGNDRAFYNAMVFGDKRLISDELHLALQSSGLNHIAVVSGMHLSVAIAFITVLFQKIFGKRRICYFFILASTLLLTLVTGAGTSVVRAFIMCALYLLSQILYRENDPPTSLSFSVIVMVFINPFVVFDLGFILSVLSVTGIFLFGDKLFDFFGRFSSVKFARTISVSISAQLLVIPVAVYYFGSITPYSLLANTLLVPLAGIYVILGMAYVLTSYLPISYLMKFLSKITSWVCLCIKDFRFSLMEFNGSFLVFFLIWAFLILLIYLRPSNRKRRFKASLAFVILTSTALGQIQ